MRDEYRLQSRPSELFSLTHRHKQPAPNHLIDFIREDRIARSWPQYVNIASLKPLTRTQIPCRSEASPLQDNRFFLVLRQGFFSGSQRSLQFTSAFDHLPPGRRRHRKRMIRPFPCTVVSEMLFNDLGA